ncbi:hypothetical protein [Lactobacillus selangorensis]|uniref:hypothetical protein n=1 Tax=Lactobacillus selangorensis TaxID=81857 RepID=UPI00070A9F98|nr:hypothetical protein [Lactobacillus selangorensis]
MSEKKVTVKLLGEGKDLGASVKIKGLNPTEATSLLIAGILTTAEKAGISVSLLTTLIKVAANPNGTEILLNAEKRVKEAHDERD